MFSILLIDFVFGVLLTVILYSFYAYFWFFPSPFNTDWVKVLLNQENYAHEHPFNSRPSCFEIGAISFALQLAIPLACLMLKRFLTSQLSILDTLIICTAPPTYFLCLSLLRLWTDYTGGRNVDFIIVNPEPNDREFEHRHSLLYQKYKDFQMELIEKAETGTQAYKIHFKADPPEDSRIKELTGSIMAVSGGLLAICLISGLIAYLLFLT